MYPNIMDNPSMMLNFRNRNGFNRSKSTHLTQKFLEATSFQKQVKAQWEKICSTFEKKYSKCKTYDFFYIKTFVGDIPNLSPLLYKKLKNAVDANKLEEYLLKRMYIDPQNLNFKNTLKTNYL